MLIISILILMNHAMLRIMGPGLGKAGRAGEGGVAGAHKSAHDFRSKPISLRVIVGVEALAGSLAGEGGRDLDHGGPNRNNT